MLVLGLEVISVTHTSARVGGDLCARVGGDLCDAYAMWQA